MFVLGPNPSALNSGVLFGSLLSLLGPSGGSGGSPSTFIYLTIQDFGVSWITVASGSVIGIHQA